MTKIPVFTSILQLIIIFIKLAQFNTPISTILFRFQFKYLRHLLDPHEHGILVSSNGNL